MRTILHGTCLLNGKHPPGSTLAKECPVLNAERRATHARKAAQARWRRVQEASEHPGDVPPDLDAPAGEDA